MFKYLAATCYFTLCILSCTASANVNTGRFGLGVSNQADTSFSAISFKVYVKPKLAIGGLGGASTSTGGGHAFGLKVYKSLVQEENLIFYGALFGALISDKSGATDQSGFQGDVSLGTEFFFQGLEHIGFSFEAGFSVNNLDGFVFKTNAQSIVQSAIHFYL